MIQITGDHGRLIKRLVSEKMNFTVASTTNTKVIEFEGYGYIYSDGHFKKRELGLFSALKKEVRKNIKEKGIFVPPFEKSKYFHYAEFEKIGLGEFLEFENCFELDINKAYYNVLFNLGYVSKEFYDKCLEQSKKVRLALVGSLATKKICTTYVEGIETEYEVKVDEELRRVFFEIVAIVDKCLYSFAVLAGEYFLFYWVDGIYLKEYPKMLDHLKLIEFKYNVSFSVDKKNKIILLNQNEFKTNIGVYDGDNYKIFNLPCIFIKS